MKSIITTIIITGTLALPGARSLRGQEALATPPPLSELASQRRADYALLKREKQMAEAQRAMELAQAVAPAAPRASAGPVTAPARDFQNRFQKIVGHSQGGPGKSLVIRTSDAGAKSQVTLEEDLAIMSRILDKKLAQLDDDRPRRAMGIDVFFGPGSSPIRSLYLEGFGALFLMGVNFPLLPPPEKVEPKEKAETDSTWDDAKRELSGHGDAWSQVGKAFKFATTGGPQEEYDEQKVNELKDGLLEALKNATNIRNLKADENITVCVFGGASAVPAKVRVTAKRKAAVSDDDADELILADRENGPPPIPLPARGTIMTIRVKKSDVDAFAQGKLSADEFRTKAAIIAYAGDTGGWSGGGGGWGGGGFGIVPN